MAIELEVESIHLYIAIRPSVSPKLRNAAATWIRLMQQMSVIMVSEPSVAQIDPKLAQSLDTAGPVETFIANVYRVCHAKLLDVVEYRDWAPQLLEEVSSAEGKDLEYLGLDEPGRSSLVESLKVLISMAGHDITASSVEEILRLHRAAKAAGKTKDLFPETRCKLPTVYSIWSRLI